MITKDLMTGTWFLGAMALIIVAMLFVIVDHGKRRSPVYDRSRWLIVSCNLLVVIDMAIHFLDNYYKVNPTVSWIVNILFIVLLLPLYYIAIVRILREPPREYKPSREIAPQPDALTTESQSQEDVALDEPGNETEEEAEAKAKAAVNQWVAERHFIDPDITLRKALQQMGISDNTLTVYLENHTDAGNFRKWLTNLRIEEAKRLMFEHPEYSIQAIAEACGYANNASLSRSFKAQEGMPPTEWFAIQKRYKYLNYKK